MDEFPWRSYVSALLTGLVFGYVIQRGGFCLTRAISNAALTGDTTILRAYVLALLVAMVGVQILETIGLVEIPIRPLHWVANLLGGLLFGVGMIISGGCSGSTWYRLGEGAIGAARDPSRVRDRRHNRRRRDPRARAERAAALRHHRRTARPPTLYTVTHLSPWIVIAILAAGAAIWLLARPRRARSTGSGAGRSRAWRSA